MENHQSLKTQAGAPDFAGAWETYRRNLAETSAIALLPWERVSTEIQESFCSAWWYLLGEGEAPVVSAEVKPELLCEITRESLYPILVLSKAGARKKRGGR
ncbi:MAG: hypothetical protein QM680_14020 [Luteolibacter sp.]